MPGIASLQVLYSCIWEHQGDMAEMLSSSGVTLPVGIDVLSRAMRTGDADALAIYLKGHHHMVSAAQRRATALGKGALLERALELMDE